MASKKKELLSEEELKNLYEAINEGESDNKYLEGVRKIKVYDFNRPERFTNENIRIISTIHDKIAPLWVNLFREQHNMELQIKVASVDRIAYEEMVRSTPTPTTLIVSEGRYNSIFLPVPFTIEIPPNIIPTEQYAANDISAQLLEEYSKVWSTQCGLKVEFNYKFIEKNVQLLNLDSPKEMGILITLKTKIKEEEGIICI